MLDKDKEVILRSIIYPRDPSRWTKVLIKKYLRYLNSRDRSISVNATQSDLKENLINWITQYDSDLIEFYRIHRLFEKERSKSLELLNLPDGIKKGILRYKENFKEIEYNPYLSGTRNNPEIVYAKKTNNYIEIWMAIELEKQSSYAIDMNKLSKATRSKLQEIIEEVDYDTKNLISLNLKYCSSQRIINIIKIDLENNKVLISTDSSKNIDFDQDETIKPENRFESILISGIKYIDDKISTVEILEIRDKKILNKDSARNIRALEMNDMLIIPYKFVYDLKEGDLSALSDNNYYKFTEQNLKPAVSRYFNNKGTFVGFLKENTNYDAEHHSLLIKNVETIQNIERSGEGFYIFLFNEKDELICTKIQCNIANGSFKIDGDEGSDINDRVIKELDKLFS